MGYQPLPCQHWLNMNENETNNYVSLDAIRISTYIQQAIEMSNGGLKINEIKYITDRQRLVRGTNPLQDSDLTLQL